MTLTDNTLFYISGAVLLAALVMVLAAPLFRGKP